MKFQEAGWAPGDPRAEAKSLFVSVQRGADPEDVRELIRVTDARSQKLLGMAANEKEAERIRKVFLYREKVEQEFERLVRVYAEFK